MSLFQIPLLPKAVQVHFESGPATLRPARVLLLSPPLRQAEEETRIRAMLEQGCRLKPEEYLHLEIAPEEALAWSAIQPEVQPQFIISCGIPPPVLGIHARLPAYTLTHFCGAHWVFADTPATLADPALRGRLWNDVLKPYFT